MHSNKRKEDVRMSRESNSSNFDKFVLLSKVILPKIGGVRNGMSASGDVPPGDRLHRQIPTQRGQVQIHRQHGELPAHRHHCLVHGQQI